MNNMSNWFIPDKPSKQQTAIYKLLVGKKGLSVEQVIDLVKKYKEILISKCTSNRQKKYYIGPSGNKNTLSIICEEWCFSDFLLFVSSETGVTFKKRNNKYKRRCDDFADQQLEYMMHGGSIEDF